jgi:alanyl-tRNA synthetase
MINKNEALIHDAAVNLKAGNAGDISRRAEQVMAELRASQKAVETLNQKLANIQIESMVSGAASIGNVKVVASNMGSISMDALRITSDTLKDKYSDIVALLAAVNDEKISFVCVCGKDAVASGCHAGNIVKEAAKIAGGGGGGKPDSATAGGKNTAKLNDALNSLVPSVKNMLKI